MTERLGPVAATPSDPGTFLALAPMDGVTDWVYRDLLTDLFTPSGISLCVSEFVRVTRDPVPVRVMERMCPEIHHGGTTRSGVPVFVQLLGGDPEPMAETARTAEAAGAPGIDLNFGCPAKVVNNHDGGAAILRSPSRVEGITRAVRDAVQVPVTVKIRVGWDDPDEVVEIARAAEAGGASWLTVHGRTRTQGYRPPVHWDAIGRARAAISIPVVANGDLNTVDDVARCRAVSGCEAFMLGRGTMGRPDIFRQLRGLAGDSLSIADLAPILRDYVCRLLRAGAPPRAALGRLKQWLRLGAHVRPAMRPAFDAVKTCQDLETGLTTLARLIQQPAGMRGSIDPAPREAHLRAP